MRRGARFGRCRRLRAAGEFTAVLGSRCRSRGQTFTVSWQRGGDRGPRLGLGIAKKRVRRAHQRNRIKRLIRESFRNAAARLGDCSVVVLARSGAASVAAPAMRSELDRHWQRVAADRRD